LLAKIRSPVIVNVPGECPGEIVALLMVTSPSNSPVPASLPPLNTETVPPVLSILVPVCRVVVPADWLKSANEIVPVFTFIVPELVNSFANAVVPVVVVLFRVPAFSNIKAKLLSVFILKVEPD